MQWFVVVTKREEVIFPDDLEILQSALDYLKAQIVEKKVVCSFSCPERQEDWVVMNCERKEELKAIIKAYPLSPFLHFEASEYIPPDMEEWLNRKDLMSSENALSIIMCKARQAKKVLATA